MSEIIASRRSFLVGLGALIAAPAIVRASVIMPVKPVLIVPEPAIITDLTFQIEGFARYSAEFFDMRDRIRNSGDGTTPRSRLKYYPDIDRRNLADFKNGEWKFTDHPANNPVMVTLRDGSTCQRIRRA